MGYAVFNRVPYSLLLLMNKMYRQQFKLVISTNRTRS